MASKIRADVATAKQQLAFIESIEIDDSILNVFFNDGRFFCIMLPDEYPRGEAAIIGDDYVMLPTGDVASILTHINNEKIGTDSRQASDEGLGSRQASYVPALPQQLLTDLEELKAMGYESTYRKYDTGDFVEVDLLVKLRGIISRLTAEAWGAKFNIPLCITLRFDGMAYTRQSRPPRVTVTQSAEKFPLGQQLVRMLSLFLSAWWKQDSTSIFADGASDFGGPRIQTSVSATREEVMRAVRARLSGNNLIMFNQLIDMGFDKDHSLEKLALSVESSNEVDHAVEWLLNSEDEPGSKQEVVVASPGAANDDELKKWTDPEAMKKKHKESKLITYNDKQGLLAHLVRYVCKRIPTSNVYCVICDREHTFGGNQLKPAVCSRELCVFGFHELKLGTDAAESVATEAGVVDLLLTMFKAAATSERSKNIFKPFPSVVDPNSERKLALDPENPDYSKVRKLLKAFPETSALVQASDLIDMRTRLDKQDPLAYPLLQWIVSSNRAHIIKLKPELMPSINANHKFLMLTSSPEKEAIFSALKKKHGTKWAFHGSNLENWHSILRNGLINFSGTQNQVNGAAHGSGIYFAPQASASMGYSRADGSSGTVRGNNFEDNFMGKGIVCLALCELIDCKEVKDHGWCWTLADETRVATRFFFVFEMGNQSCAAETGNSSFIKEITAAMESYGMD